MAPDLLQEPVPSGLGALTDASLAPPTEAAPPTAGEPTAGPPTEAAAPAHPSPTLDPTPSPLPASPNYTTLVVEEGFFRSRLRRPRDLLGAVLALVIAVAVVLLAVTAQQTVIAIDDDLADAQRSLPEVIWGLLSALAGLGVVMLPLVAAVSMLVRRRGRQLLESIAAMTVAAIVLTLISTAVRDSGYDTLYAALTGSPINDDLAYPTNPLLGGTVAFVTVARLMSRPRWNVVTGLIVASTALVGSVSAGSTSTAQALSFLVGLAIGLLTRYILGTPTTRPSGADVATTLITAGIPLVMLRARGGTFTGRHYMAVKADGGQLDVVVLDRDLEGSGLALALWRTIRLREANDSASGLSMRSQLDRAAMMAYAAQVRGGAEPAAGAGRDGERGLRAAGLREPRRARGHPGLGDAERPPHRRGARHRVAGGCCDAGAVPGPPEPARGERPLRRRGDLPRRAWSPGRSPPATSCCAWTSPSCWSRSRCRPTSPLRSPRRVG